MATTRDLLSAAYRKINALGAGDTLGADDADLITNGLYALDILTDKLSNERLMIYSIKPYVFYTNPGQKVYTLGPQNDTPGAIESYNLITMNGGSGYNDGVYSNVPITGGSGSGAKANIVVNKGSVIDVQIVLPGINYLTSDLLSASAADLGGTGTGFQISPEAVTLQTDWAITRPMKIEKAYVIWNTSTTPQAVDIPIALLTVEEYASISVKNTPSTFAFGLYDDNAWPVRNITVFPIPTTRTGVRLWLRQPLIDASQANLDSEVDFPPGYEYMFVYNLADELKYEYGKNVPPDLPQKAQESRATLRGQNQVPMYRKGDGALTNDNGAYFNYITGNPGLTPSGWWGW